MTEPLDLVQVRHDQRRTAALLGRYSFLPTIGKYGGHHSYLPFNYWGKPRNVKHAPRPNVSFIRTVLNDDMLSLPNADNKLPERSSESKLALSYQSRDKGLSLVQVQRKRDSRLLGRNNPASRSLPCPKSEKGYSPGKTVLQQSERLPNICEAPTEEHSPDSRPACRHNDNLEHGQLNKKFSERLTVHVPRQDGSHGHSSVQKLSSSGDVLPPLVSIHSSVSTINHTLSDNNYFSYHHTKSNEIPNLPHFDSILSCTGDGVRRNMPQSSPYHIRSTQSNLINGIFQSQIPSNASRRSSKLVGYRSRATGSDLDVSNGLDIEVSIDDIAAFPVYSDISSSVGSFLGLNVLSNPSESFDGSFGHVDSLVQDSTELSPVTTEENTKLVNQTYVKGEKPQKRKPLKGLDKGVNIHRRAYLAALSVARSRQLPNDSRQLGKRISRSFQFSYFQHIPHQRPCRCSECRERMVNNAIVPKKNKQKKLSPIKSIFGSVKVEDYYFASSSLVKENT